MSSASNQPFGVGSLQSNQPLRSGSPYVIAWTAVFGALALAYLAVGFFTLLVATRFSYPVDLRLRWIEQCLIQSGVNPQETTYPEHLLPELIADQKNVKGNYPPWAYVTGFVLAPPISWEAVRATFACINLIAIAAISYWIFTRGEQLGSGWGLVATASALATFPFCVCLSYGQYSIVVLAFVLAALEFLERKQMFAAGLALGIAAIKPQVAGLCFLIPLIFPFSFRQKLSFMSGAAGYIILASVAIAWRLDSTPWDMLMGTANESVKFYLLSNNPLIIWSANLFGFSLGSKLLAAFVAGVCAVLLFIIRKQGDLLAGFSICTILAMYWSYSRHYDLVMFTIPLVELLILWKTRSSKAAVVAFVLLGILLWSPIRIEMSRWPAVELAMATANLLALITIVASNQRSLTGPPRAIPRFMRARSAE